MAFIKKRQRYSPDEKREYFFPQGGKLFAYGAMAHYDA